MIGQTVTHYQILQKIGQGGMGVVYKAKDLKLGRMVALKFLPESVRNNSRALHQLTREARAASALNHPNICTVYEIDEYQGQAFIAMELLEGETLRSKLHPGPLPVSETLSIVLQVLEALVAVHSRGIVHRDLKPENVFICTSGQIKLLDFGLAKVVRSVKEGTFADTQSDHRNGLVGTVGYMSPEQVRDEDLSSQSDLFSLGAVMHEMLCGSRAFSGNSLGSLLEAVLTQTPPKIRSKNPRVPTRVQIIVEGLLEKDCAKRYASATDVRADIRAVGTGGTGWTFKSLRTPLYVLAAALAIGIGLFLFWKLRGKPDEVSLANMVMTQLTNQPGLEFFPSLSPDGRMVAYASSSRGNWDIFILRVGGKNAINLTPDSSADDTEPAFSPSGDLIAFRSERDGGGIYVMGATGESVRRLTNFGFNPSWSPDGRQLVVAEEAVIDTPNDRARFSKLFIVDVESGQSRTIDVEDGVQPRWSPHQQRIAFWAQKSGQRDLWTIRPDGSDVQRVTNDAAMDWNPVWDPRGAFLYFSSDRGGSMNLWRIPIDESSGKAVGQPQAVTSGAGQRQHVSFSADGRLLAYVEEGVTENIHRRPLDVRNRKLSGSDEAVTRGTRVAKDPNPSPDGQWIAFQSSDKQEDIVVARSDGTGERYLTNDEYKDRVPRWSPDGNRIAFYSNRSGNFEIWVIGRDGSGLKQITDDRSVANIRSVWSPDGRSFAGFHFDKGSFILDLDSASNVVSRTLLPPIPGEAALFQVWSWSPDGKWIAGSRVTPAGEYKGVAIYSVADKKFELLTDTGYSPAWLANSRDLIFMNAGRAYLMNIGTKHADELGPANGLSQLSADNAFIYFTIVERESDVWLIDLHKR